MRRPENVLWLLDQVKSPWIKNVYDYSHYKVQGLDMRETMKQVVPGAVFIHVKDGVGTALNHRFLLPGDSREIDYKEYVKIFGELRYTGPVVVEVSVHVFDEPGYDGIAAAKRCWENLGSIIV